MMADYKELIKELRRCCSQDDVCDGCSYYREPSCEVRITLDAADAIEELLAERDKWHDAEKQRPKETTYCLYRMTITAKYDFSYGRGLFVPISAEPHVVEWSPLPAPPKEEEE